MIRTVSPHNMFLMDADKGGRSFPEFIFSTFVTLTSAAALNRAASQMFPVVVSKVFSLGSFQPPNISF